MGSLFTNELAETIPNESFRRFLYNGQVTFITAGCVGFILTLVVLFYELRNRRKLTPAKRDEQKWLLLWALLTMISSVITQILCVLYKVPEGLLDICPYTTHAAFYFWAMKNLFLGLFQLNRLNMTVNNEKMSSPKLRIPKWVFTVFYVWAFEIFAVYLGFMGFSKVVSFGEYGCYFSYTLHAWIFNLVFTLSYVWWDLATLCLYIKKLLQFRSIVAKNDAKRHKLHQSIKSALSKILLLTIINEITFNLCCALILIVAFTYHQYIVIVFEIVVCVDTLTTAYVMLLMQMHNRQQYHAFISVFHACGLACCCRQLTSDAEREEDSRYSQERGATITKGNNNNSSDFTETATAKQQQLQLSSISSIKSATVDVDGSSQNIDGEVP